jgi:hypothetical protein
MKLLTERLSRKPLAELSADEMDRVRGGDRGFVPLYAFDDEGDALADADAHGAERIAAAGAL